MSVVSGAERAVPAAPLASQLARFADLETTALLYTDETCSVRVSYEQLWARTNALARALAARARPYRANRDGDFVVAVCMKPTHETVMALLACWKVGAAYLPMEVSFPQQRIDHILQDAQPALVIFDSCCNPSMFASSGVSSLSFEELSLQASGLSDGELSTWETLTNSCADSVAILLYTSGSTGIPKGVRLPYSAICNRLWWQYHKFPFTDNEAICVWKTSLTFLDSLCEIWGPLVQGRTLLILSREITKNPQELVQVLAKNQVHRLVVVPTLLRSILTYLSFNNSERPLQNLKLWVCSGETLSKDLAKQFFQYFGDNCGYMLANFYGSTEVMADVTYHVLENTAQLDLYDTVPIGSPLDNCEVYLLDDKMQLVCESEAGEIWVAGDNLACGYVGGQPSDRFHKSPYSMNTTFSRLYRSGDFGIMQKGVILYVGRADSQVKIRGHRVDLQEVEHAVTALDGVKTAVVLCYGTTMGNPEIPAFVTLESTVKMSTHDIETALQKALVSYMLPQVVIIESVPLLISGKVDRQALVKIYENSNKVLEIDYSGVDIKDMEKARVLFETVGEVLGCCREVLSIRAGFYEVGGNSLNTIITITKLRDKGYYIEISEFLAAATLGEVLSKLSTSSDCHGDGIQPKFSVEPLRDEHKHDVINMVVNSTKKALLCQFLGCNIEIGDYERSSKTFWPEMLRAGLSIVLREACGSLAAVAWNIDAYEEVGIEPSSKAFAKVGAYVHGIKNPVRAMALQGKASGSLAAAAWNNDADEELKIEPTSKAIAKIGACIDGIENSVRAMIPKGKGKVLKAVLMATASHLSARDNVAAIYELEHEVVRLARDRGFLGIFATNSHPLTQQLGRDVLGYQTLLDYQINQYVDCNGDRIYRDAPDDVRVFVCWKPVQ